MIPFVVESAISNGAYTDRANISTEYGCTEKCKLHTLFIDIIINDMYEFCSDEYGHGINIKSYDEYCYHYSKINCSFRYAPLYMMHYFMDGVWKIWDPIIYDDEIYMAYITKKDNPMIK